MTTYKWLRPDHRGAYGHGDYTAHLPHGTRPGKWLPAVADPETCARGYHVVTASHLPEHWGKVGSVLYVAEARGEIVTDTDKLACEQIRLVSRVGTLTREIAVTFAADCAERVLPVYEAAYPDDDRPRKAIEAARAEDAAAARAAEPPPPTPPTPPTPPPPPPPTPPPTPPPPTPPPPPAPPPPPPAPPPTPPPAPPRRQGRRLRRRHGRRLGRRGHRRQRRLRRLRRRRQRLRRRRQRRL